MLGFQPQISGVGSDCSTNWATTFANRALKLNRRGRHSIGPPLKKFKNLLLLEWKFSSSNTNNQTYPILSKLNNWSLKIVLNWTFYAWLAGRLQKGEFTLISYCVSTISRTLVYESTHHLLNMFQIIEVLETSGYENLITFAHGDAKPNNFMFRNIEIDIEDLVSWPLTSFQPKI